MNLRHYTVSTTDVRPNRYDATVEVVVRTWAPDPISAVDQAKTVFRSSHLSFEHPTVSYLPVEDTRPHLTAFGTVDRDYNTGEAPVKITMPSGHVLTLDPEQPPIYAAEHLHTGQRVAWAPWLAGNAVVGAE